MHVSWIWPIRQRVRAEDRCDIHDFQMVTSHLQLLRLRFCLFIHSCKKVQGGSLGRTGQWDILDHLGTFWDIFILGHSDHLTFWDIFILGHSDHLTDLL